MSQHARNLLREVAHRAGTALVRVMKHTPYCPVCKSSVQDVHAPGCDVARALEVFGDWAARGQRDG